MLGAVVQTETTIRLYEPGRSAADQLCAQSAILVVRIPKSASTTLAALALQALPDARRFLVPNTLDLDGELSAWQRLRHWRHAAGHNARGHGTLRQSQAFTRISKTIEPGDLIIGGHADFDTCRRALGPALKFVTVVRNPTTRVISEYTYARAGHKRKRWLSRFDASLVAKAAARYDFESYLDFLRDRSDVYADIASRYIGLKPGVEIAAHLAANAFHIGTVDNMTLFAREFGRKTGVAVGTQHLNPTVRKVDHLPTPRERTLIEQLYARDFELYEECLQREAALTATRKPSRSP